MNVVFSYGMGANGTAALLRLLFEPATRPPELADDLSNLIVITAQTGDEFLDTAVMVEQHIYPLLAARRVRTVQVARAGHYERDGIVVLDDTREPILCLTSGAYALLEEMTSTATVPQSKDRKHSQKFKGWVIDQWLKTNIGDEPYLHVMGYDVSEPDRVAGDLALGLPNKIPWYPLVDWGWDWDACERYIFARLGVRWKRSHCVECPFAFSVTKGGRARTIPRLLAHPHQAMDALTMEYLAVACNPKQGLIAGKEQLYDLIADWPGGPILLKLFHHHLDAAEWAVYDVQRGFGRKPDDPMKRGQPARSMRPLITGSRTDMLAHLERAAGLLGRRLETDGRHWRVWWRRRGIYFPTVEHLLTAAPALAQHKTNSSFPKLWREGLKATRQLELAI
ncbi:hypothetical protein SAMN05421811_127154 [Nonomuraea wenchangensis]|uniref:Uncharacterized protein n=2 Tax=Nonomuraea wenchangensis TaxID=568860 RepID=A0A1I0LVT6_9ACTN|nr:hypothetical protein SAMN05421811_127154 [Nonomuraea wenchangensis]